MSRSTWKTRNDSSNMSAILAPNDHEDSDPPPHRRPKKPRKPTIYSYPTRQTHQPQKVRCETCYCQQSPQPPLLNLSRPHTCPPVPKTRRKIEMPEWTCFSDGDDDEDGTVTGRSKDLLDEVHRKIDYVPKTIFLSRLKEEAHKNCSRIHCGGVQHRYTRQREEYEELAKEREEYQNQRIGTSDEDEGEGSSSPRLRGGDDSCQSEYCDCSNCLDSKTLLENTKKVPSIQDFRRSNYFETHSVGNLLAQGEVGKHRCLHTFTVDEHLVPIPENLDPYGQSRCAICSKPMAEEDMSKKTVDSRLKAKNSKGTVTKKEFKGLVSLEPKKVYVPTRDEKVEVKLPIGVGVDGDGDDLGRFRRAFRPVPVSSVALRFQKGVI